MTRVLFTTESVPISGDNTTMLWYWESSHYKKDLGDLVLDRIFDYSDIGRRVSDDFGVRLTSENISSHFAKNSPGSAVLDTYTP
jgi:hypothetical protein